MNVLVTGGAGYIGSHAALRLLSDGHRVVVIDDLSRGNLQAIRQLESVGKPIFVQADFGDRSVIDDLLRKHMIDAVMHFAAFTYVGESVQQPLRYYHNNAAKAVSLLQAMETAGVKRMVFSSTAATYGEPPDQLIPIREDCPQVPINPYGSSKLMVERVLQDFSTASKRGGKDFAYATLRYFNVAGNDEQCRLGEDHDPETHLIPLCLDAALGKLPHITIFGDDYPTPDGTCIRDYVHVSDLIDAHVTVLKGLKPCDALAYNVGIGRGHSVREVVNACRRVSGVDFAEVIGKRREGDPPSLYADPACIKRELKWSAKYTHLDNIIESAWRWRKAHPNGYE